MEIWNKIVDFFANLYALYSDFILDNVYAKIFSGEIMTSINKYADVFVIIFTVLVLVIFISICSLFKKKK